MLLRLLQHHFKENIRSHVFAKNIALKIFLVFLGVYITLNLLFIGYFLEDIIRDISPEANCIQKVTQLLFFYFLIDILIRVLLQKLPTISIAPYLHLPIKRKTLVNYILIRSAFSFFNLIPLFLVIPFAFRTIAPSMGVSWAFHWVAGVLLLALTNNYISFYIKKASNIKPLILFSVFILVIALFYADIKEYITVSTAFQNFFYTIANKQTLITLPLATLIASYVNVHFFLKQHAYLESLDENKTKDYNSSNELNKLNRFGLAGQLIQLDLKLIWRNKRPRSLIIIGVLFAFYGLLIFKDKALIDNFIFLIAIGTLMTGLIMANYGQFIPSWDSSHFDLLLTQNISPYTFYLSKYYVLFAANILNFLLTIPYILIDPKIVYTNIAMVLFNCGFNTFLILYLSTFNSKHIDLQRNAMFNYQGTSIMQFLIIILLIGVPLLIYMPFAFSNHSETGIWIIGALGISGILFKNSIIQIIAKQYSARKYKIAAGFRQK